MNRPLPPPTAQLRVKPLPLIDPCALLRMVLSEGGPCSVCECTSTHKWYGGVRKPFRCKQCYETEAKASKTPAFGTLLKRPKLQGEYNWESVEPEDNMLWQIHEVLGQRCASTPLPHAPPIPAHPHPPIAPAPFLPSNCDGDTHPHTATPARPTYATPARPTRSPARPPGPPSRPPSAHQPPLASPLTCHACGCIV
jgi:hypothetical protein